MFCEWSIFKVKSHLDLSLLVYILEESPKVKSVNCHLIEQWKWNSLNEA